MTCRGSIRNRSPIRQTLPALVMFALCCVPAQAEAQVAFANDLIQFTEQSFIQNVFGNQRSYAAARKYTDEALQIQIDFVASAVQLSDQQREKLELAGQGDIHRFFNEYERVKRGMTFGGIPRDEWQAVWRKTQPLSTKFAAGLHGPKSLFAKTVSSALDDHQRAEFDEMKETRDIAIYVDNIRMTLSMLERKVPLTRKQRDTIIELLVDETEPPDYYGQASMHFYVVLVQMAKMPQEKLKPVFSNDEWQVIDGMLRQAKAMEQTLKMQREALGQ